MGAARKTILLVEDDANDVFLFSVAVRHAALALYLQTVADGQQAIDYLQGKGKFSNRNQFPIPDAIVVDLKLPHVNGFEFLAWWSSSEFISIPVVVLEGSGKQEDQQRAQEMGAILTFTKPCELEQLCEIVEAICTLLDKQFQQSHGLAS